ncbi:MAG: VCBS repeat-containing protein [Planctomycetales bacterium]|nr:VCBS repeat-containing protein [Planctomycetales bacterium]
MNAQGITTATNTLFQATGQGSIVRVTSLANKTNVNITEQNGGQVIEPGEGEGEPLAKTIIGVRLDPWNGAFVGPIQIMQPILESTVESFASTSFSLTASGEQTPPEPVLSQRFAYDPLFNQLVYESDGRGKQTLYKIDPTNGNTLAMTYVVGNPVSTLDAQTLTLGDISGQHTFADVTGDGKQDLIYIDASKVYVAINTLDGFGTAVSISGTTDIAGFAIADLDKNGTSEIYAADPTAGSVLRWVLGTGAGFGNPSVLASIPYAQQLTFGDVDSDNDLDLVVEADNGGLPSPDGELKVHVFANNGSNQFTLSSTVGLFTKSNQSTGVAVVDLDLDGKMDIAALRFGPLFNGTMSGNTVEMLWGNGSTSYSPSSTADRLPFSASHIALRDVDSDGDIDIYGEQFYLLANSGRTFSSGSFAGAPNYYVNSRVNNFVVRDLIFADLNGDGFADRIEAHDQVRRSDSQHVSGRIEFQLGKAGGELGTPFSVPTDINPHDLVLRDFDGDGTLDLSYVSGEDNELTIQPDFMGRYFGRVGDADDSITRYTYTPQGLIDTVTDPKGRITDYDYDALGRLIATTEAKGTADQIISRMEYDPNTIAGKAGLPTATIDPNGNRSQIQYDSMNRVVKTISPDPDGTGPLTSPTTQFEYDAEGNLTKQIDAEGHATTFEYDARNRRIVSIQPDPDGAGPVEASREQYEYDNNGNLVATIDPLGNITRAVYDARNRVVKQIDARGGVTSFEYDRDNNMVALTDPVGNRTTFAYDARNRMTSETDPLGKTIQYIYDGNDNLIEKIDRLDRHTTYGYDDLDRVVRETWVDGDNEILYTYDIVGNLLNVRDAFSEYAYTYDNLDRVLSVNNAGTPDAPHSVLVYTYDSNSKVTSVHDTIDNVEGATTSYVYDTLDRLTMLVQTGPDISDKRVDFSYNSLGQYTSVKRYNDLGATENVINTFYTYDSANRLKAMDHLDPSNAPVAFFHYEYDLANRITRITDVDGTVDYTYDATNQLTTADYSDPTRVDEWFVYDSNGNRLASFQAPSGYVVDVGNRITADGTTEYFYNAEGNLVRTRDRSSGDVINYSWDYRNRLTRVTGDSGEIISSYTYGAENSRLATASADQEDTVWYVYDRGNVLLDGTNVGDVFAADSRNVHSDGLDKLIASSDTVATTNWWITDHVGSIVGSVSEGAASASPQYSAFGVQFESPFLKFSYTGRETESSHDMLYYRARYYSPILGRFLSEDPVRHRAGDSNLYRYVSNSPISKNDPTGLVEWFGTVAILSATGNVGPQPILSFGVTFVYVSLQTKCIGGKKGTASGLAVLPTISVGLSLSSVVTPLKLGGGTVSPIVMNDPYNSPQPDALGGLAVLAAAGLAAVRGAGPTTLRLGAAQGNLPNNALYVDLMIGTTAAVGYSNVKGEVSECCDK